MCVCVCVNIRVCVCVSVYVCIYIKGEVGKNQVILWLVRGFPDDSVVKNMPANTGDASLIPGLGRSPGEANGNAFQYSCLENPMDRGGWQATVWGHRVRHDCACIHKIMVGIRFSTNNRNRSKKETWWEEN